MTKTTNILDLPKFFLAIKVGVRYHVICEPRFRGNHPAPNYQGTGMALCGVIDKNKTLEYWIKKNRK